MNRTTFAATGVCALFTAVLSAQTSPAQPASAGRTDAAQNVTMTGCLKPWDASTMGAPMTGGASSSGQGGGMAAGTAGDKQYVLTNASSGAGTTAMPTGSASGTPAPSSAGGGNTAMGAHSTYLLKAQSGSVNLAAHVGHKVEVTGTLAMDASKSMGATHGAAGATGSAGSMGASGSTGAAGSTPSTSGSTPTSGAGATADRTAATGTTAGAASGMAQQHGGMTGNSTFTVTALKMIDKTCS